MPDHKKVFAAIEGIGAQIERIQPLIGAEISGLDLRSVPGDADKVAAIRSALLAYRVLFFRNQPMDRREHVAFARELGELDVHPLFQGEFPEVLPILSKRDAVLLEDDYLDEYLRARPGANTWHTDLSGRERPPMFATLRSIHVPPIGGDTLWSCAAAAYEGLDEATRARIDGVEAEQDMLRALSSYLKSDEERAETRKKYPVQRHPVVRMHPETGEKLLYVNASFTTRIIGMEEEDSARLLARLFAQFHRPEYQVRFKWSDDAVVLWDERATQHYAVSGFEGIEERTLERVTVCGERPYGAVAA